MKSAQLGRSETPSEVNSNVTKASQDPAFEFTVTELGNSAGTNIGSSWSWTVINWNKSVLFPFTSDTDQALIIS